MSSMLLKPAIIALAAVAATAAPSLTLPPSPQNYSSCDPLDPSLCMFPFPNNFWLRSDGASPALLNVTDAFPVDWRGTGINASQGWNALDGFSPMPQIVTYFPNAALTGLPPVWNPPASLLANSCSILIDTSTGELVTHWVELDHFSDDASGNEPNRTMMLWPSMKLKHSTRYIVAYRNLVDVNGAAIPLSPAFQDLRDGIPSGDWDVEGRRRVYADIFARLAAVGFVQNTLNLAWDFTTGSQAATTQAMVFMRDDAFSRFPAEGPEFVIDSVTTNYSSDIGLMVQGYFSVPWYLNSPNLLPWIDCRIVTDPDTGLPVYQYTQAMTFTMLVPWSLMTNTSKPGRVVQYGHGLFGDQGEVETGYLQSQANQYGYVLVACDWTGMSQWDAPAIYIMLLTDLSNFAMIPDRLHQGMLNFLTLMHLARTGLANDPLLQNPYTKQSYINPATVNYYGNSQGGIMGSVYMALSTEVTAGCIGVGGGPFGILLPRSSDFSDLGLLLKLRYGNPLELVGVLSVIQLLWDRLEPAGYIDAISQNLLPNTPAHRVIFQYGIGDAQVTYLGLYELARTAQSSFFESNLQVKVGNETIYGFQVVPDDTVITEGNVAMGFWFPPYPTPPFTNTPSADSTDAHELPRRTLAAQAQMYEFFSTGQVTNTCNGPCKNMPSAQ